MSPPPTTSGEVSRLLDQLRGGHREALDRLFPLVYHELRQAADRVLRREMKGHTLQPTALVHEAYLKLAGGPIGSENRAHFLGIAARAMRPAFRSRVMATATSLKTQKPSPCVGNA